MIYFDDVACALDKIKDMETGFNPVFKHFNRFGFQMHTGSNSKTYNK